MDVKARWVDNVIIERWFRSLKAEYVYINEYANPQELRSGICNYVEEYNAARKRESLEYKTPDEAYYSKKANRFIFLPIYFNSAGVMSINKGQVKL